MAGQGYPIIGFIHVCMINEYLEVFIEQVNLMKDSGLYDMVSEIKVGCVGSEENAKALREEISKHDKIKIREYDKSIERYEFITLDLLKKTADIRGEFYGFYIHSKGVSWPRHEGGKYWRDYMNHYILTVWRENVRALEFGYDTCGVKLINRHFPLHYSGNFFWFKSDYIKLLIPVKNINQSDRMLAEMWIGSGQPICATICQDFVDYNNKGIFKP